MVEANVMGTVVLLISGILSGNRFPGNALGRG